MEMAEEQRHMLLMVRLDIPLYPYALGSEIEGCIYRALHFTKLCAQLRE